MKVSVHCALLILTIESMNGRLPLPEMEWERWCGKSRARGVGGGERGMTIKYSSEVGGR